MSTKEDIGAEIVSELVKKTKLETALVAAKRYLQPGISRGPNNGHWVEAMKLVGEVLGWPTCDSCDGAGEITHPPQHVNVITGAINKDPKPYQAICRDCLSVGKVSPDE